MEEYIDKKVPVRPFKRDHSYMTKRLIDHKVVGLKNDSHPPELGDNGCTKTSTNRSSSKRKAYASTKGFSIKTKTKSYELR